MRTICFKHPFGFSTGLAEKRVRLQVCLYLLINKHQKVRARLMDSLFIKWLESIQPIRSELKNVKGSDHLTETRTREEIRLGFNSWDFKMKKRTAALEIIRECTLFISFYNHLCYRCNKRMLILSARHFHFVYVCVIWFFLKALTSARCFYRG